MLIHIHTVIGHHTIEVIDDEGYILQFCHKSLSYIKVATLPNQTTSPPNTFNLLQLLVPESTETCISVPIEMINLPVDRSLARIVVIL